MSEQRPVIGVDEMKEGKEREEIRNIGLVKSE